MSQYVLLDTIILKICLSLSFVLKTGVTIIIIIEGLPVKLTHRCNHFLTMCESSQFLAQYLAHFCMVNIILYFICTNLIYGIDEA